METANIFKRIGYAMQPKHNDKKMVKLWIFWILFCLGLFLIPQSVTQGSVLILLPLVGLFIYALTTQDVMSALILGTLAMYIQWYKLGTIPAFFTDMESSLCDEENIEMYMSFFLCGGIIIAMKRVGATDAFTNLITKKFGRNEKLIMTSAGLYAGATSVDDYVSALTAGAAFSPLCDAIKKPRVAMAYVIRTLSINVSMMLPFGAWGYFVIYQIAAAKNVGSRAAAKGIFLQTVPFMFYCIVACVVALLFALGVIPKIGKMKEAYRLIQRCSVLAILSKMKQVETIKIKGSSPTSKSTLAMKEYVKEHCPQIKEIICCETLEEAIRGTDIISEAVSCGEGQWPEVKAEWLKPGCTYIVTSTFNMEYNSIKDFKKVVDNIGMYDNYAVEDQMGYEEDGSREHTGVMGEDFVLMAEDGIIERDSIIQLGEIIRGKKPGRESHDEIILVSIEGMPIEDVTWGYECYHSALEKGIGTKLKLWDKPYPAKKILTLV